MWMINCYCNGNGINVRWIAVFCQILLFHAHTATSSSQPRSSALWMLVRAGRQGKKRHKSSVQIWGRPCCPYLCLVDSGGVIWVGSHLICQVLCLQSMLVENTEGTVKRQTVKWTQQKIDLTKICDALCLTPKMAQRVFTQVLWGHV